jgi:hypothetical protein
LDNLRRHRIISVPERRRACLTVYLLNISNSGMMAEYRVRIGTYRVYVRVLNLHFKIRDGQPIGSGTFGAILEKSVAKK